MLSAARSTSNLLAGSLAPQEPATNNKSSSKAKYKASRSKRCKSLLLLSSSTTSSVKSSLLSLLQAAAGAQSHPQAPVSGAHQNRRTLTLGALRASSYEPHSIYSDSHQQNQQLTNAQQQQIHQLQEQHHQQQGQQLQSRQAKCVKIKLFEQPLDKLFSPKAMKQLNQVLLQQQCLAEQRRTPPTPGQGHSSTHKSLPKQLYGKHKRSPPSTYLWKFSIDANNNNNSNTNAPPPPTAAPATKTTTTTTNSKQSANSSSASIADNAQSQNQLRKQLMLAVLPEPIRNLLNELYLRGPTTVGIFRKSPNAKHCRELRHKLEADSKSSIEQFQVTVIASVFKEWLRSLPDCLLMSRLYPQWIDVAKLIEPLYQHHLQKQQQLMQSQSLEDSYGSQSSSVDTGIMSSSFDDTITTSGNGTLSLRTSKAEIQKGPLTDNVPLSSSNVASSSETGSATGTRLQLSDRALSCSTMALSKVNGFQSAPVSSCPRQLYLSEELIDSVSSNQSLQNVSSSSSSSSDYPQPRRSGETDTNQISNNIESMSDFALAERRSECLRIVRQLLDNLNKSNLILLSSTISVLWRIADNSEHNKMSASNLGVCVGQSLLNDEHQSYSSGKIGGALSGIGSSSTFGKRHRRTRSQCLLSSTLSLSSSSPLSSAYLESNGAQEAAKYVPILVAFMIENAPDLFGRDIMSLFEPIEDKRQDLLSTSVTESTTSSSRASSSTSGIHSESPAFSNELESQTAQASTSNSSPIPSTVSSPSPVISPSPSSPIQGEATPNRSQTERRQQALHQQQLHNNRYVVYSTGNLDSLQYQPRYDRYMWYHGNSLEPQRSHVMSLRDYYLSLQQQHQQQQQLQSTLLRSRAQQMTKNQATSSHAIPADNTMSAKTASRPSSQLQSAASNVHQRRCQLLSRRQLTEPTLVSYHTLDDRTPVTSSVAKSLTDQPIVTSHMSVQRPQPRLAKIRQNLFSHIAAGPTSHQHQQTQHLHQHLQKQQLQQQHHPTQQQAVQQQHLQQSGSPLTRYVRGAGPQVSSSQQGGKLKLGASSGSSSDERDSSDDSDLNEGWAESTMV